MNTQIQEIAQRLKGLREDLNLSLEQLASVCNMSADAYKQFESGQQDLPVGMLQLIAQHCNVELSTLLFGDDPRMHSFYLTRAGQGTTMERTHAYKYQALAAGFADKKAEPFIVTVEPKPAETEIVLNAHNGQEFNFVLDGTLMIEINGHKLTLQPGDSLYFNATLPHGMLALNGKAATFLAIIL